MNFYDSYIFKTSGLAVKNRIALAPMTNGQSHRDGTLGEDEYRWLIRRAKEDFGMIITCASHVLKDGQGWEGELGIYDDFHIPGLRRLADGIHAYGAKSIVQLFHGGARSPQSIIHTQPWSASDHIFQVGNKNIDVREGTTEDIERVLQGFSDAAKRAFQAGFAGVEIHGAHGYLLHQFISTFTNKRTDKWGGNFENRIRLIRTILKKIKQVVPSEFIVGVRLSPEDKYTFKGIDFDESLALAGLLADDGADYIHVSPWDALKKPDKYLHNDKHLITYFRETVRPEVAIMVAGEMWSAEDVQKAMDFGADFVALGRAAIGIPDWPHRARNHHFIPHKPPYTVEHLNAVDLSPAFIRYMSRWKDFVVD